MTCIANFKTKKSLKEHVAVKNDFNMEDPSIFKPFYGTASEFLKTNRSFCVTNHPKRSWFASVTMGADGKIKIS